MSGWLARQYYCPELVLLVGLSTFTGFLGIGLVLLRLFRLPMKTPWRQVVAVLVGIQLVSLIVQLLAFAGMISRGILATVWAVACIIGFWQVERELRRAQPPSWFYPVKRDCLGLAVALLANVATILVAAAPSTKIDELHYHMLLPARIVADGGLVFYRCPFEGAILPQMGYQIAAALVHALYVPDGFNVTSWGLGLMLQFFTWSLVREAFPDSPLAGLLTAAIAVGMFPVVWFVTAGAHAMGALATAAGIVAIFHHALLTESVGKVGYGVICSILALSSAASKVIMFPLAAVLMIFSWTVLLSGQVRLVRKWRTVIFGTLPWLIFLGPIMLWTYTHSGSPFGPYGSGIFGNSIYDVESIRETFRKVRRVNQPSVLNLFLYTCYFYSPLVWVGLCWLAAGPMVAWRSRVITWILAGVQGVIVFGFVYADLRFTGGMQYGFNIALFTTQSWRRIQELVSSAINLGVIGLALLFPWLALEVYYAAQFFPVVFHLESKEAFFGRHVAFYNDFAALDRLLPDNAVLLIQGVRLDSVYAPRPVFFDSRDLPQGQPVFLFQALADQPAISPLGYHLGSLIYENPQAVSITFRTVGKSAVLGKLTVYSLIPL